MGRTRRSNLRIVSQSLCVIFVLYNFLASSKCEMAQAESGNQPQSTGDENVAFQPDGATPTPGDPQQGIQNEEPVKRFKVPYSSSPLYLTNLARSELVVFQMLGQYEKQLLNRLHILQRYRQDYEESTLRALEQSEKLTGTGSVDDWAKALIISSHPALVYRMIRRFTRDIRAFNDHIWQSLENEVWESLESLKGQLEWPTEDDLFMSSKSMIKLQDTYDFDIHQLAEGIIKKQSIQTSLTAAQCLEISNTALQMDITSATEWFRAAHSKGLNQDNSITMDELTVAWEKTYKAFQSVWPMEVFKTHDVFTEAKRYLRADFEILKYNRTSHNRAVNFKALCRGDNLKTKEEQHLLCYEDRSAHPYWLLNPLRIEVYNSNPLTYQVYDFLGSKSMFDISATAIPEMIYTAEAGFANNQVYDERTFTYTWLHDSLEPLNKLSKRIQFLKSNWGIPDHGVTYDDYESYYQISSFAVGNHYEPCVQCFEPVRIDPNQSQLKALRATVHLVLQEPELGGQFAFTLQGSTINSAKGSLIVYTHRYESETFAENILHGSCPVLLGQKWVATKLIYE